jgi:hypothetical protein
VCVREGPWTRWSERVIAGFTGMRVMEYTLAFCAVVL